MKYAIISDVHANLEALTTAFGIIDTLHIDEVICLGDLVGYGANPNECVEIIRKRCSMVVLGNHDDAAVRPEAASDFNIFARTAIEWTTRQLATENLQFLAALPLTHTAESILFVHSSPNTPEEWDYLFDSEDARAAFPSLTEKICFIGHTHVPGIFSKQGQPASISPDEKYIINVGSIGQPRDVNPRLAFGVFDSDEWTYELFRAEYNIQLASDKILNAGLPQEIAFRLMYGM